MGPRFLTSMLPFLGFPIALSLKRFPGPTVALAAISITTTVIATITHPLVGYENETVDLDALLGHGSFQPTIASAFGLGRGWGAIWPFALRGRRGRADGRQGDPAAAHARPRSSAPGCWRFWRGRCSPRSRPRCSGSTTGGC